jgi:hypothetical protein
MCGKTSTQPARLWRLSYHRGQRRAMSVKTPTLPLFEEDFLVRTVGQLAHRPDLALTELVANAWDAGASTVRIVIPTAKNQILSVEDDGHGMTRDEFRYRWMRLAYNRLRHQGRAVQFPAERADWKRQALGRQGIGRHALVCFADEYVVETWRENAGHRFSIITGAESSPFVIRDEEPLKRSGHGTKLRVRVERHLPAPEEIRELLSARFLHDPKFELFVNGETIPFTQLTGLKAEEELNVAGVRLHIYLIDAETAARRVHHQGIAFWVSGRLVGHPSWVLGNEQVIDGRTRIGKRFTAIVKADALADYVLSDWEGFRPEETIQEVYGAVGAWVRSRLSELSRDVVAAVSADVLYEHKSELRELSTSGMNEVAKFVEDFAAARPTISQDVLSQAAQIVINLEKSRSGAALLDKLAKLETESDIDALDRLLAEWSVHDALAVLDEIDSRLSTVAAIERLSGDKSVDELKTLHPLVASARWLFGPEYDSPEYASNVSLVNAAKIVLGKGMVPGAFISPAKRPDLVFRVDTTFSIAGTEAFDTPSGLMRMDRILIVELKKGGFVVGRDERQQAANYVEDFLHCGAIEGSPYIRAFVVGHTIHDKTEPQQTLGDQSVPKGQVNLVTYAQLVRTAHQRLFKLRDKVKKYGPEAENPLLKQVLAEQTLFGT